MNKNKRPSFFITIVLICIILSIAAIYKNNDPVNKNSTGSNNKSNTGTTSATDNKNTTTATPDKEDSTGYPANKPVPGYSIIDSSGNTLMTRIRPPEGFKRTSVKNGSLTEFLRNYKMKKDGSPVLLYDGRKKGNQSAHAAVFKLPLENEDLQQCADSVMRVYAEYFWHSGQKDRIKFHFTDGFSAEYSKWKDGYRILVNDDSSYWVKSAATDNSYKSFKQFMRMVFAYSGTLSMEAETIKTTPGKLRVGDIFIKGGSPGHVVMIVDLCKDKNGRKAFLLAQGYMPAQEFHVLKNPAHENDLWYYENEIKYPFNTPEYTFDKGSLRKLKY